MNELTGAIARQQENGMILNQTFRKFLEENGLIDFEAIYRLEGGKTIKKISDRSITRIDIDAPGAKALFLKRHEPEKVGVIRLLAFLNPLWSGSQGRLEFENICAFRKRGIPAVTPVACGERRTGSGRIESFVITEDFHPWISLEEMIRKQPAFFEGQKGSEQKDILMDTLADLAKAMHRAGFNHRDFNATHILLRYPDGRDIPEAALFDLQRVDRKKIFRFRWVIKALAELSYSLPADLFTPADRLRLFRAYKGKHRLNPWDIFQFFWIKRKTARISRHTDNMMARRAERRRQGLPER